MSAIVRTDDRKPRWFAVRGLLVVGAVLGVVAPVLSDAPVQWQQAGAIATASAESGSEPPRSGDPKDVLLATKSSLEGLVVAVAEERRGWRWRTLATIRPASWGEQPIIGQGCLMADGLHAVVVLSERSTANSQSGRDRGAVAYSIRLDDGHVVPLVSGVALKYYNPGCGRGGTAAFVRHFGADQARSEILLADVRSGALRTQVALDGQFVSAVPLTDGSLVATIGSSVVRLEENSEPDELARLGGRPFNLVPTTQGGVELLVAQAQNIEHVNIGASGTVERVGGDIPLGTLRLAIGEDAPVTVSPVDTQDGTAALAEPPLPAAASLQSRAYLIPRPKVDSTSAGTDFPYVVTNPEGEVLNDVAALPVSAVTVLDPPSIEPLGGVETTWRLSSDSDQTAATMSSADVWELPGTGFDWDADGSGQIPECAVPRNHLRRQVPQPSPEQVNWAIQLGTRNALRGSGTRLRPAQYLNMENLVAYDPSSDFVRRQLAGAVDASVPVPPSVIQGIVAQESAWRQASWRALPGVSSNPLVGDYYGAQGGLASVDYNAADCGYGLTQVTRPMTHWSGEYSYNGKRKVAVDYAENVAAGIQFLVEAWNATHAEAVANNGNPSLLENWYMAAWAYNTGWHESGELPDEPNVYGLGWTNNPMNADYPPDRRPFLRDTYADAEHPSDWPYQERVFGWMETPILLYDGTPAYAPPNGPGSLASPSPEMFCDARNDCDVNYDGPGLADFCTRADRRCWWHWPVTFVVDNCQACHTSQFTIATTEPEPSPADSYPSRCVSGLPPDAVIVDSNPDPALNVEGCPSLQTEGRFEIRFGREANGDKVSVIDWHQLGAGYGGHTWFTKNRASETDIPRITTGRWYPPDLSGRYNVRVHVPATGATTASASYSIHDGAGTALERMVDQHLHGNRWVPIGNFTLSPGAYVELNNVTHDGADYITNVAYDAIAFIPVTGTAVEVPITAFSVFDSYTDLTASAGPQDWRTHDAIYEWGNRLTTAVTTLPPCLPLIAVTDCVAPNTRAAFMRWQSSVEASGRQNDSLRQQTETYPVTQADWLGLSGERPPVGDPTEWVAGSGNPKTTNELTIGFTRRIDGSIDPDSLWSIGSFRTGDSEFPTYLREVIVAVSDDYDLAPPDLTYNAQDLNTYSHHPSAAARDPLAEGVLPGRQYLPFFEDPTLNPSTGCVEASSIAGGTIGWRPFVAQEHVREEMATWTDAVAGSAAPTVVKNAVSDLYDKYFQSFFTAADDPIGTSFLLAPPIWIQLSAAVCADGSVTPRQGSAQIIDASYMPDVYLWADGAYLDTAGLKLTCSDGATANRGCAALTGDYRSFTGVPTAPSNAFVTCQFDAGEVDENLRRNGNPWHRAGLDLLRPDHVPTAVRLCDAAADAWHEHR